MFCYQKLYQNHSLVHLLQINSSICQCRLLCIWYVYIASWGWGYRHFFGSDHIGRKYHGQVVCVHSVFAGMLGYLLQELTNILEQWMVVGRVFIVILKFGLDFDDGIACANAGIYIDGWAYVSYLHCFRCYLLPGNAPMLSLNFRLMSGMGSSRMNTFKRAADTSMSYWFKSTIEPTEVD